MQIMHILQKQPEQPPIFMFTGGPGTTLVLMQRHVCISKHPSFVIIFKVPDHLSRV